MNELREEDGVAHLLVRNSSNVRECTYTLALNILEIRFQKPTEEESRIYKYYGVPEKEWQALLEADSIGKYVSANIVNVYAMEKIQ